MTFIHSLGVNCLVLAQIWRSMQSKISHTSCLYHNKKS
uniref:Uncharacterized protein n=1 Tax=Rhizophora mucronata TaxID=61149 RepID=A0A2P2NTZ0_RHIMU